MRKSLGADIDLPGITVTWMSDTRMVSSLGFSLEALGMTSIKGTKEQELKGVSIWKSMQPRHPGFFGPSSSNECSNGNAMGSYQY